jgi:site-specific DNA-methyltransferase (adenine-specific)
MQLNENTVVFGKALDLLRSIPDESIDIITTDPPFNTGVTRKSQKGDMSYIDMRDDYYEWLKLHVIECQRVLKKTGTLYIHLNEEAAAYARVLILDPLFGRKNCLNSIIWSFNYGGRGKKRFPKKHEVVLSYCKNFGSHIFNWEDIDRVPYIVPSLQKDKTRALRGQVPTDVWPLGIIGTQSKQRTGYPTQKPITLAKRMIVASCPPGGVVLDMFAGSGTAAVAAHMSGRAFVVCDENPQAIDVMKKRFDALGITYLMVNGVK